MKEKFRKFSMLGIVVMYCFAILAVTDNSKNSTFTGSPTSDQKTFITNASSPSLSHIPQLQHAATSVCSLQETYTIKKPFKDFSGILNISEQSLIAELIGYDVNMHESRLHFNNPDIIFPAHYFW